MGRGQWICVIFLLGNEWSGITWTWTWRLKMMNLWKKHSASIYHYYIIWFWLVERDTNNAIVGGDPYAYGIETRWYRSTFKLFCVNFTHPLHEPNLWVQVQLLFSSKRSHTFVMDDDDYLTITNLVVIVIVRQMSRKEKVSFISPYTSQAFTYFNIGGYSIPHRR